MFAPYELISIGLIIGTQFILVGCIIDDYNNIAKNKIVEGINKCSNGSLLTLVTSFYFIINAHYAFLKNKIELSYGCDVLAISSILYHGFSLTVIKPKIIEVIRRIDSSISSICIGWFMVANAKLSLGYFTAWLTLVYIYYIYIKYDLTSHKTCGDVWHATIHIISNIGIIALIID